MKKLLSLLVVLLLVSSLAAQEKENCFTVAVGKRVTQDGSVLLAHNEDDPGDYLLNLRRIPSRTLEESDEPFLEKGPLAGRTTLQEVLWFEVPEIDFADSFVNEKGVVVVSNACPSREDREDVTDGGVGYLLRRLVIERARSSREAAETAGKLIEAFGYTSSGRTYTFADKNEAWILAVVKGRRWVAQRVPDDGVVVVPNHYVHREVNLEDKANFMGSPDLISYARERGWYDPDRDGAFDFSRAYGQPSPKDFSVNTLRRWRGVSLITGKSWDEKGSFPFSVKPGKPLKIEDLTSLLRDHYEGTNYDESDGYKRGNPNTTAQRTICTASTKYALVAHLREDLPEGTGSLLWLAPGRPDSAFFIPVWFGAPLPEGVGVGGEGTANSYEELLKQHFDGSEILRERHTLAWALQRRWERYLDKAYGERILPFRGLAGEWEGALMRLRSDVEKASWDLCKKDPPAARFLLGIFMEGILQSWQTKMEGLLTREE